MIKFSNDNVGGSGLFDDDDNFNGETSSTNSFNELQPINDYRHEHHRRHHQDNDRSLKRVLDLVSSSQRLVQQDSNEDSSLLFDDRLLLQLLEPTPIGPRETQTIVMNLPLADIHGISGLNNQDLISYLAFFGNGSTSTDNNTSNMNKKRPAFDENNQVLAGTWPLPNQRNKTYKSFYHPTVSELQSGMRLPTGREEAQDNIIFRFDDENMIQGNIVAAGPKNANLFQPQEHPNNFSSNISAQESSKPTKNILHPHHCDQWNDRFQELIDFKTLHGHCFVPHEYPTNPKLSQWVKRQRYQHRLKHSGRHSTMTDFREHALDEMEFVWDSQGRLDRKIGNT